MWDLLASLFAQPSDFSGDPVGGLGNQVAHALVVGGGGFFLLMHALIRARLFTDPHGAAWQAVLILYAAWEAAQAAMGSTPLDSLTDWSFVAAGATFFWTLWRDDPRWARIMAVALVVAALAYMLTR